MPETPPLSRADLVATMGEFQSSVMQGVAMQIKQQSDLLLGQIGQVVDSQLGDLRKEIQTKQGEQDSKIFQLEARMAQFDSKLE
eukprot:9567835-Karenia_brevis.AAC.1